MTALMIAAMHAGAEHDAEARQQPAGDDRADDADHDVADQAEAESPCTIRPASQPAIAPTISQAIRLSTMMCLPRRMARSGARAEGYPPLSRLPAANPQREHLLCAAACLCAAAYVLLHCNMSCGRLWFREARSKSGRPACRPWCSFQRPTQRPKRRRHGDAKDLYEIGEIPPLGHVPGEDVRVGDPQGAPRAAGDLVPGRGAARPGTIADDEVLVFVMAAGVNYNGVWAGLGTADLADRRPQESRITSRAPTRPASCGRSATR